MNKYLLLFLAILSCGRASAGFQQILQAARQADRAVLSWNDEKIAQYYGLPSICAQFERPDELHSLLVNLIEDEYKYESSWKTTDGMPALRLPYCSHEEHYNYRLTLYQKNREVASFRLALDGRSDAILLDTNEKVQITRGSCLFLIEKARFDADMAVIKRIEEARKSKPNKAVDSTDTSVTPPAAQEPRHP